MEFSFSFTIRDDSGKVMTYEEYRAEKKDEYNSTESKGEANASNADHCRSGS